MLEIERKWLLGRPDLALLQTRSTQRIQITQSYLKADEPGTRRIRHSLGREEKYEYFTKRNLRPGVNEEHSRLISPTLYLNLLQEVDPRTTEIRKTRHLLEFEGLTLEIDQFHNPEGLWLAELELLTAEHLEREIILPAWLDPVSEVTGQSTYSNAQLALRR